MEFKLILPGRKVLSRTQSLSHYRLISGEVLEVSDTFVKVKVTKYISRWANNQVWKTHPTSCIMSVRKIDIIEIN